jgi:hypothetical protein
VRQAQSLEDRAMTLTRAVARFRLQQGTAEEAVTLVERAQACVAWACRWSVTGHR